MAGVVSAFILGCGVLLPTALLHAPATFSQPAVRRPACAGHYGLATAAIAMGSDDDFDRLPVVAAIHHDGRSDIDARLAAFAAAQRALGRRVCGLLMTYRDRDSGCQSSMVLQDIDTGDEYLVSQPLGSGSNACSADPQGFARASRVLRDALGRRPDLVICNRFGSLEAENGGFVAELLALMAQGIPVLTVVSTRHLDAWRRFIGEAPLLPDDPHAWTSWLDEVCSSSQRLSGSVVS